MIYPIQRSTHPKHPTPARHTPPIKKQALISLFAGIFLWGSVPLDLMASEPAANKNYMGVNTWYLSDWDQATPFTDLVKTSRRWEGGPGGSRYTLTNIDAFGWPNEDGSLFVNSNNRLKAGIYHCSFEGSATLWVNRELITNQSYDRASNLTTFHWVIANDLEEAGITFEFKDTRKTASSPANTGIKNFKIIRPGYTDETFTTEFVTAMNKFQCIRFMDWLEINMNDIETWDDRTLPAHHTQDRKDSFGNPKGVSFEYMVELCNLTDSDLWLNIPCRASDEFVN